MSIEVLSTDEVHSKILGLKGDAQIFVGIQYDESATLRYVQFKKTGFENLFLSYMNQTSEDANKLNLDELAKRYSDVFLEEASTIDKLGRKYLGDDLYSYLSSPVTEQTFYIDFINNQIVIYNKKDSRPVHPPGCGCDLEGGSCTT